MLANVSVSTGSAGKANNQKNNKRDKYKNKKKPGQLGKRDAPYALDVQAAIIGNLNAEFGVNEKVVTAAN
jgi:ATP-dependent helicase YprA (DUF1998 family)